VAVADETRVELKRLGYEGRNVLYEVLGDTTTSEEGFWYFATRCIDGIDSN
jgi:hypothetical protein